jgi:twitching motility protein PilT
MGMFLALPRETPMDKTIVDGLLTRMLQSADGVSDLLFITGRTPLVEAHGRLEEFPIETGNGPFLTSRQIEELATHIAGKNERLKAEFEATGSCDCSYEIRNVARLRVNIFRQNGQRGIVMRKLEAKVPSIDSLGLSPIFREIVGEKNGIILVTGAAGNGKTTTLAALINELNQTMPIHIVTLEDPIEFLHPSGRAAVTHRELGTDFPSFPQGLRAALRQAPKVILVGEIRDRETMEIAMTAAETGHVVFSTLHTINAGQSINRILGFFTKDEETLVRDRLADTLRYIVSQRLVSRNGSGRLLITEIMGSNLRTRETIRYGESESKTFAEIIEASAAFGWHTFDQCLLEAREADLISYETALSYSSNRATMRRNLDLLAKKQGVSEGAPGSELKLDLQPAGPQNRVIRPRSTPPPVAEAT